MRDLREAQGWSLDVMADKATAVWREKRPRRPRIFHSSYLSRAERAAEDGLPREDDARAYEYAFEQYALEPYMKVRITDQALDLLQRGSVSATDAPTRPSRPGSALRHERISVLPGLSPTELKDRVARSQQRIWMLDTWIRGLDVIEYTLQQTCELRPDLKVRIALSHPDNEGVINRSNELASVRGDLILDDNIRTFEKWKPKISNLEVRFYRVQPSIQLFIFDDEAVVGVYFHSCQSQDAPQLVIPLRYDSRDDGRIDETTWGTFLRREFERVWEVADEVMPRRSSAAR
jgi:hypothetical protein